MKGKNITKEKAEEVVRLNALEIPQTKIALRVGLHRNSIGNILRNPQKYLLKENA